MSAIQQWDIDDQDCCAKSLLSVTQFLFKDSTLDSSLGGMVDEFVGVSGMVVMGGDDVGCTGWIGGVKDVGCTGWIGGGEDVGCTLDG
ncbi:hypothetical protein Tco_0973185 [Tanacetum coccineum]